MIGRLLIANRGEIARRVIRTARRMGVTTVAVYSDADVGAPHVREADAAVRLGPAPARESYLDVARVIDAARTSGADAVHPGYGFLSENADFAEAVEGAGLTWIGPPPSAIRAMGPKDQAKAIMEAAGVPTTPGWRGDDQSGANLAEQARRLGWPVLIKAVAGGGGKGMRRVDDAAGFADALASAQREGLAAFGDARVLLERYVDRPRHIEVQVFADAHDQVVHLFERDCSLQRRHQKVIEEAPAPGMDDACRAAVCAAAVQAARAVGYRGAGTVEFIADASQGLRADRVFFMEMNTRLQVEHPVTEMITGLDLVEWQLRVASGEPLPLRQEAITRTGWAMEARLYAEDPATGFLPSIGRLEVFDLPAQGGGVRVDAGYEAGGEVTPFYDPMLAKVIVHAETRDAAAAKLAAALRQTRVWPVRSNAGFLARLASHPDFVAARLDTGFIPQRLDALATPPAAPQAAIDAAATRARERRLATTTDRLDAPALTGWRLNAPARRDLAVWVEGRPARASLGPPPRDPPRQRPVEPPGVVFFEGQAYAYAETAPPGEAIDAASDGRIVAPMPGRVVQVATVAGTRVTRGEVLITLEAMKMEHGLVAPFDGVVVQLDAATGDQVIEGATLARLEREAAPTAAPSS